MKFKFNDFIVYSEQKTVLLEEKIAAPQKIERGKTTNFEWENKTKEITIFDALDLLDKKEGEYYKVIDNLFDFIDFVEILKAHAGNKLDIEKEYKFNKFFAKFTQKDRKKYISIHFKNYSYKLYFDQFEAMTLAAKFSKILGRVEPWQEQEV